MLNGDVPLIERLRFRRRRFTGFVHLIHPLKGKTPLSARTDKGYHDAEGILVRIEHGVLG